MFVLLVSCATPASPILFYNGLANTVELISDKFLNQEKAAYAKRREGCYTIHYSTSREDEGRWGAW